MCDMMNAFIEKRKGSLTFHGCIFLLHAQGLKKTVQKNIIVINIQKGSCTVVDLKKKEKWYILYTRKNK